MKKLIKIYLEEEDLKKLKQKAEGLGLRGRGNLIRYIELIVRNPIVFLDENTKTLLKALDLK